MVLLFLGINLAIGLLAGRGHAELVLALDDAKTLGAEEMKVLLDGDGLLRGINKAHDPAEAAGEYIGLTLIEPEASAFGANLDRVTAILPGRLVRLGVTVKF